MNINEQIVTLINSAKSSGFPYAALVDEIQARWDEKPTTALALDEDGRHMVAGSTKLWLTPIPILLGMKLTQRQLGNIMANCACNAKGELGPAAYLGYETGTGSSENPVVHPVSMFIARQFWGVTPGTFTPALSPTTRRARFRSMEEAVAYVAANPWVQ